MLENLITINNLSKVYENGFSALKNINLKIKKGEIFAMLGPNGAGKTTLISVICGIVTPSSGKVTIDGFDIIENYRETRSKIGLVPQELTLEQFETVFNNVSYTRGLYGKSPNPKHIEKIFYHYYPLLKVGGTFVFDDISWLPYLKNKSRNNFHCEINNQETFERLLEIKSSNEKNIDLFFSFVSSGSAKIIKRNNENLNKSQRLILRKSSIKNKLRKLLNLIN